MYVFDLIHEYNTVLDLRFNIGCTGAPEVKKLGAQLDFYMHSMHMHIIFINSNNSW